MALIYHKSKWFSSNLLQAAGSFYIIEEISLKTFPNECSAFPVVLLIFLLVLGEELLIMYATVPAAAIVAALLIIVAVFIKINPFIFVTKIVFTN